MVLRCSQLVRRYYNYMNFPSLMWYEKFSWNLYSCSKLEDKSMPVYSINFRYSLGHRSYFLPTFWEDYHFIFVLSEYWYGWREKLDESFLLPYLESCALAVLLLVFSPWATRLLSTVVVALFNSTKDLMKRIHCETAIMKIVSGALIGGAYLLGFWITPYWYRPAAGFLFFAVFFTIFTSVLLLAFNKAANVVNGEKRSAALQLKILIVANAVMMGGVEVW